MAVNNFDAYLGFSLNLIESHLIYLLHETPRIYMTWKSGILNRGKQMLNVKQMLNLLDASVGRMLRWDLWHTDVQLKIELRQKTTPIYVLYCSSLLVFTSLSGKSVIYSAAICGLPRQHRWRIGRHDTWSFCGVFTSTVAGARVAGRRQQLAFL